MVDESEYERWSRIFSGSDFYYGHEPGPVARRTLRYALPMRSKQTASALDVGCGEGQDLLFLRQNGYAATGVDFTQTGLDKAKRLLEEHGLNAPLVQADLREWETDARFDVVLAVNCLQFLGSDAPATLEKVTRLVAPNGVLGLSVFAREDGEDALDGSIYRWTLDELLAQLKGWQPFEAARLWQWGQSGPQPFVTIIAARG